MPVVTDRRVDRGRPRDELDTGGLYRLYLKARNLEERDRSGPLVAWEQGLVLREHTFQDSFHLLHCKSWRVPKGVAWREDEVEGHRGPPW